MILGPGSYRLKFLARENETGRIGTFEQELLPPAPQPERLELSSVLLSSQLETVRKPSEVGKEVEKKALAKDARLKASPLEMAGGQSISRVTRGFTTQQKVYGFFQAFLPPKSDDTKLGARPIFFRDGERGGAPPLVEPGGVG